jgi:signal transduction histidine kinase
MKMSIPGDGCEGIPVKVSGDVHLDNTDGAEQTPPCLIGNMSQADLRRLYEEGGAALIVEMVAKECHDVELLNLRDGGKAGRISARLMAALELCLGDVVKEDVRRPLLAKDVHSVSVTIGEYGVLEGRPDQYGHRSRYTLLAYGDNKFMVTRDGSPLAERTVGSVDEFGNQVRTKPEMISFEEASTLLGEYMAMLDASLEAFDESLSFAEADDGSVEMTVDPAVCAQLEKHLGQYYALTIEIFSKHTSLYQLVHLIRSPLRSLSNFMTTDNYLSDPVGEPENNTFRIEAADRDHILSLRESLGSAFDLANRLFEVGDEDSKIKTLSLNGILSQLEGRFQANPNFRMDEVEGEVDILASNRTMMSILDNFCENALRMGASVRVEPVITDDYVEIRVHDDGDHISRSLSRDILRKNVSTTGGGGTLAGVNLVMKDLRGLVDRDPRYKHCALDLRQSSTDAELAGEAPYKYFLVRVPRVLEDVAESEPAKRKEPIPEAPLEMAA